ncbi:MAG: hypothetical protein Q4D90_11410 [bacterium]|nr:hypothetical protein [bacterium]
MKRRKKSENRLSVAEAARLLGASQQYIRIGMQRKELEFGSRVRMSSRWTYVITKQKFEEVTGIKVTELKEEMKDEESELRGATE